MIDADGQPHCDVCGRRWDKTPLTITTDHRGMQCRCKNCAGLEEAGMIRAEMVDGKPRFRRWEFTWTPGDLLPEVTL